MEPETARPAENPTTTIRTWLAIPDATRMCQEVRNWAHSFIDLELDEPALDRFEVEHNAALAARVNSVGQESNRADRTGLIELAKQLGRLMYIKGVVFAAVQVKRNGADMDQTNEDLHQQLRDMVSNLAGFVVQPMR